MRIDAHQHFWDYDPAAYPWMGAGMEVLQRTYRPEDLVPHLDRHGIDGTIAVQARQSLEETRYLLALADASPRVLGVVGWVDLCAGDVARQLEPFAGDLALKGIRHLVQDEPDDAFLLREDFGAGVAELAALGLTYDVLIYPRQLRATAAFLERHPDLPFVVDHCAKPQIAAGHHDEWADGLRALAQQPHTCCKLSGLVTEADHAAWTPDDLVRYLDTAYEAFGEDRVMYGSDWPVCLLAGSYERVHGALERWAGRLDDAAREKLFGGNAARFYGLAEAGR